MMGNRKNGTEHVVILRSTGKWCCLHCGEKRDPPHTPLPVKSFLAKLQGFILLHRDCRPAKEGPG